MTLLPNADNLGKVLAEKAREHMSGQIYTQVGESRMVGGRRSAARPLSDQEVLQMQIRRAAPPKHMSAAPRAGLLANLGCWVGTSARQGSYWNVSVSMFLSVSVPVSVCCSGAVDTVVKGGCGKGPSSLTAHTWPRPRSSRC